ncbi:MAG: thymidine kinase [bacterium]
MHPSPENVGWIETIVGSMFSGKTEELIRRLRLAKIARQRVLVFKPKLDDRFATTEIVSRADVRLDCRAVEKAPEMLDKVGDATVVGIDEAQFFDVELVRVCESLANAGRRVIVAGLDQDFRGEPFETVSTLMAVSEYVDKVLAICVKCGNPANRSQRIVSSTSRIVVGDTDVYEARCRKCFVPEAPGPLQADLPLLPPPEDND